VVVALAVVVVLEDAREPATCQPWHVKTLDDRTAGAYL